MDERAHHARLAHPHRVREDSAAGFGVGCGEGEGHFAGIGVPVELAGGVDIFVIRVDLDGLSGLLFLLEGIPAISAAYTKEKVNSLLPERMETGLSDRTRIPSLPGVHPRQRLFLIRSQRIQECTRRCRLLEQIIPLLCPKKSALSSQDSE